MINQGSTDLKNTAWIDSKQSAKCRSRLGFLIMSMTLLFTNILMLESVANEILAQKSMKNRSDQVKDAKTELEQTREFLPPFSFTKDDFLQNVGKVLLSEDGRTKRETVERAFNVKFPETPSIDFQTSYPNMKVDYLRPRLDWYFAMSVKNGNNYSSFDLGLDSTMCIHYQEFREVAKIAGWTLVGEAQFLNHRPIFRETYNKDVKGATLFVSLSRGDVNCVTSIHMFNRS